jgi:hypothetical protein
VKSEKWGRILASGWACPYLVKAAVCLAVEVFPMNHELRTMNNEQKPAVSDNRQPSFGIKKAGHRPAFTIRSNTIAVKIWNSRPLPGKTGGNEPASD